VLVVDGPGGGRIAALNDEAEKAGAAIGEPLADARAKAGFLQVRPAESEADTAALHRLALWATRYTPTVAPWGEQDGADGFFLDITGAAHLFGGEEKLLGDLHDRLSAFGLPSRLAIAETPGAAWALTRFHREPHKIIGADTELFALSALPIKALRLSPETATALQRLGFKRVGALCEAPRAPLAARFETELLRRLDQALGRMAEPLAPIVPPPVYYSLRYLLEPIGAQEAVVSVAKRLMQDLVYALTRDGVGARALRLSLYRVNGLVSQIEIALTRPTRDVAHVGKLIDLKLERLPDMLESDFGFETLGLAVTLAERMEPAQAEIAAFAGDDDPECTAALIDRLRQRLGPRSVRRLAPVESHIPERAEVMTAAACTAPAWPQPDDTQMRPLLLLPRAEPADVTALVPEGPPQRFRWRGVTYAVSGAQGPERIAGEWWRTQTEVPTRDYYVVESDAGHRFWIYREGLYDRETTSPRWFVHGLFG